jgi:hypothetical protein
MPGTCQPTARLRKGTAMMLCVHTASNCACAASQWAGCCQAFLHACDQCKRPHQQAFDCAHPLQAVAALLHVLSPPPNLLAAACCHSAAAAPFAHLANEPPHWQVVIVHLIVPVIPHSLHTYGHNSTHGTKQTDGNQSDATPLMRYWCCSCTTPALTADGLTALSNSCGCKPMRPACAPKLRSASWYCVVHQ